jgi:type I restriction enzyme M protein
MLNIRPTSKPMTDLALADAIVRARTRNGLTQAELAEELGVSRSLVAAWETGRAEPSEELLAGMTAILGRIRREYGRDGQGSHRPAPNSQPRRRARPPEAATTPQSEQTTPAITSAARSSQMPLPVATTPREMPEGAPPSTRNGRAAKTNGSGTDIYDIAAHLWDTADELRANSHLKAAEYSIPVLGLIFLKFADNRFAEAHGVLAPKATERNPLTKEKYQGQGVLYLPDEARFDRLLHLPGGQNRGKAINDAMAAIEEENPQLRGVLPRTYQELSDDTIDRLLRSVNSMLTNIPGDAFGKVYEYFLGKFAIAEGAKGGEYFTPTPIVRLIVEIIEPFTGRILDPACGSGGMFVQSARFVDQHRTGKTGRLSIHGQEKTGETVKLAKMNLAVHGLEGDVRQSNTYYEDPFDCVGKFDYVMANPPFNVDKIDKGKLEGDRRFPFGLPRADNGNYIWIQAFYSALNERGRAGFVMANSAADAGGSELAIRRKLIEDRSVDVVVAVGSNFFYTVTLPVTLWFLDRSKRGTERDAKVLFIDARKIFRQIDRAHRDWTPTQMEFLANVVRLYRGEVAEAREGSEALVAQHFVNGAYRDVPGLCAAVSLEQIEKQGCSLNPGRYVGVAAAEDDGVDFKVRLRELGDELTRLNIEASALQERIGTHVNELLR